LNINHIQHKGIFQKQFTYRLRKSWYIIRYLLISLLIPGLTACGEDSDGFPENEIFSPPKVSQLGMTPRAEVNVTLSPTYVYFDEGSRPEQGSVITWFIDNAMQTIAPLFTPTKNDETRLIHFCITPIAAYGSNDTGSSTCSQAEQIAPAAGEAPEALEVNIPSQLQPGQKAEGNYLYYDADDDHEGESLLSWFINGELAGEKLSITLPDDSEGNQLKFCVTPKAVTGSPKTGVEQCVTRLIIGSYTSPIASDLDISPSPITGTKLLGSYLFSDANNRHEGGSLVKWKLNGITSHTGISITLPASTEQSQLSFCVTPIAAYGNNDTGKEVCSSPSIIVPKPGSAPVAIDVMVTSELQPGQRVVATYLYEDADNDIEGASITQWLINGIDSGNGLSLPLPLNSEGNTLQFCVTPMAQTGQPNQGELTCSPVLIIAPKSGAAPVAGQVAITTPLQPGQSTSASYLYSDADGDIEGASVTLWRLDGVDSGNDLTMMLPADSEGKPLQFCVTPVALTGAPNTGFQVCDTQIIKGSYTPPEASNLSISPSPVTGTLLTGSYLYSDANNRPEDSSTLVWKVDGSDYSTGNTVSLPVSQEGNSLSFCVTPIAAYGENNIGSQTCTSSAIAPRAGSAPSASNLSWDSFVKPSTLLTVSYDYSDDDGDNEGVSLFSWKLDNVEVSQNISYTPAANSGGKSLSFCVSPVAVSGSPKTGAQVCITSDIAAILLTGELKLGETLTLDVKGYTETGVTWKSTHPTDNAIKSTSNVSYTIARSPITQSAMNIVGYDVEMCVTTTEEGEICKLASQYPVTAVTGGLPMTIDGSNQITSRAVAPVDYIELTIATVTKRLHRPLSAIESTLLNVTVPAAPLPDGQDNENGSNVFWGLYTWSNADALCTARTMTLAVEGNTDVSDPFGLKQFYDDAAANYGEFADAHATNALGWGTDNEYYWSSSDIGGGSHRDFYMVSGAPGTLTDTTPEYAACLEIVP